MVTDGFVVETVSPSEFFVRLDRGLKSIPNARLAEKLRGWGDKSIWVQPLLDRMAEEVEGLKKPFWEQVNVVEFAKIRETVRHCLGIEMSAAALVAAVQLLASHKPDDMLTAVTRVSIPWIVRAMVVDEAMAEMIEEKYDLELGRKR